MDILISLLKKEFLEIHISEFIEILEEEPHEYWKETQFNLELPYKYGFSVVAYADSAIAGYIIASLKEKGPYIHKFMVKNSLRRMKIGEKMLRFFEKNLIENGFSTIDLSVIEENDEAIDFYRKNLFKISGTRIDSKDKTSLVILTKNISSDPSGGS